MYISYETERDSAIGATVFYRLEDGERTEEFVIKDKFFIVMLSGFIDRKYLEYMQKVERQKAV